MVSSRLIVEIEGREAVPVRAIPYITGWQISPDALAYQLAEKAEFSPLGDVQAFRLVEGVVIAVLPKEWSMIAVSLDRLQGQLKAAYPQVVDESVHPDYGYAEWQHQSPKKLPADTFVWLSDFEAAFRRAYAKSSPTHVILLDEVPGDRDLVYSPLLPDGISREDLLGAFTVKAASNAPIGESDEDLEVEPVLMKEPEALTDRTQSSFDGATNNKATTEKVPLQPPGKVTNSESVQARWGLRPPERMDNLQNEILKVLKAQLAQSAPKPKARQMMSLIQESGWPDFMEICADELKYCDGNGTPTTVTLNAMRKRINRLTTAA